MFAFIPMKAKQYSFKAVYMANENEYLASIPAYMHASLVRL